MWDAVADLDNEEEEKPERQDFTDSPPVIEILLDDDAKVGLYVVMAKSVVPPDTPQLLQRKQILYNG
ncbi:hypothetical protein PsorP6_014426 [Peronosclerospora sorghi]|uniref:Uncharacterized protein n=1 Tax=Peronosclerospora sorghi TaxID=230839 RepID=A0ACC0VJA7_9STRA|nr:hypothetical protein PsorP6_014426 [Peronosclerospora sorghi]